MSKPIKLTDNLIESIQSEFVESVKKMKMFGGKISYTKTFKWDGDEKASVTFSDMAFAKMVMLLHHFKSEVAWHGVALRDEKKQNHFYITDILVYPQIVSGSTVNTDQEEYTNWLYRQEDDVFNNIRMQGHSHVDFSTNPSGVDETHQEKILSQLDGDMFYIFMIWNKKFERTIKIYDMKNNTLYENGDVDVFIGSECVDLNAFISDADSIVKSKPTVVTGYQHNQYAQYNKTGTTTPVSQPNKTTVPVNATTNKSKPKSKDKTNIGRSHGGYDDYYDGFCEDDDGGLGAYCEKYYR